MSEGVRVFLLDNYDSFTWNLAQYMMELGAEVRVERNDQITVEQILDEDYDGIVVSPGPGRPEGAGITLDLITQAAGKMPLLGVCLGHQAIGQAFGATVVKAPRPMHGKTSRIAHDARGVFEGVPNPLTATRYHSLMIDWHSLPPDLEVSAIADDAGVDVIMGIRHVGFPLVDVEGVQFHPESIMTIEGKKLLANFLKRATRC